MAAETAYTETPLPPSNDNSNVLLAGVTNLNAHLTAPPPHHGAAPVLGEQRPAFDVYAARCTMNGVPNYQTSQNQQHGNQSSSGAVPWNTADDRALEKAVVRETIGLLFVGVKT